MSRCRLQSALFDMLLMLIAIGALVFASTKPAHAYVDPSVMTYTIQALAGVAVALSAVLGVALRRTRRTIMRVFHIDENANKEVEPDVTRVDPDAPQADILLAHANEEAREAKARLRHGRQPKVLSWKGRFARAFIASLFLIGTVFIVAPLEVVAGSASSLTFGLLDVMGLVIGVGLLATIALALLLSCVRGKGFDITLTIVVALGICAYVQAMFLNTSLPIADGNSLDLTDYTTITVISLLAWIVIIAGALLLNWKQRPAWRVATVAISVALVLVQAVGLTSLAASGQGRASDFILTEDGIDEVASQDNVIVFVLDMFDTRYLDTALANDPGLLDDFTGFTYFRNSTGSMIPTRYGIPYLLTGVMPEHGEDFEGLLQRWYPDSSLLPDIKAQGYDIGVYTDSVESSYLGDMNVEGMEFVADHAKNIVERDQIDLDELGILGILDKIALYRDAPWIIKPLFWFYTDEVNRASVGPKNRGQLPYLIDDAKYHENLENHGLHVSDREKAFRFIHLLGPHFPHTLNEAGYYAGHETSLEEQARGSIAIVEEYITQLKKLGLYDNATIVITADHGEWYITPDPLLWPSSPIMLVKPPETAQEAAEPLKVSGVPTGHVDYPATIVGLIGGDASKYGPTVFDVTDGPRERSYWMTTNNGRDDTALKEYVVNGDALNLDDWHLSGEEITVTRKRE